MSSVVIAGDTSGTVTLQAPAVAGTTVLTLPTTSGTLVTTAGASALTTSGNLTFTGTGNRILGDFSNATTASRVMFQTSTTNSSSVVGIIPNGTSSISAITGFNSSSDPDNAGFFDLRISSSQVILQSSKNGTGTYLPMNFYTGGAERLRIDTSGNVGIGTASPAGKLTVVNNADGEVIRAQRGGGTNLTLLRINMNESANTGTIEVTAAAGNPALSFATAGTEAMRIDSSGNALFYNNLGAAGMQFIRNKGLGTTNSGGLTLAYTSVNYTPASASSSIYWDGNTGFFTLSTSSAKYKRNITPITNEQLDKALDLKPSYYQRLEHDYWEYGFIAEEVEEIGLDEFVTKVDGEVSGLNYEKMVTLAFGLIQRQEKAIQELKAEVDALKAGAK